jgi:hypothetical protein
MKGLGQLGKLKSPMILLVIKLMTFWLQKISSLLITNLKMLKYNIL